MTHRLNKGGNFTLNKHERLDEIAKLVNKKGTIRTNEIVEGLNVSDMTVRRDLIELENKGILTKIHGGARSNSTFQYKEISHKEKHTRQIAEKRYIARKAASLIEDGILCFRTGNNSGTISRRSQSSYAHNYYELFAGV